MFFVADSFYEIGNGHTFCQDYACHGEHDQFRWGVVSDGCSGVPNSDIGARLLAVKTSAVIRALVHRNNVNILSDTFPRMIMDRVMLDCEDYDISGGLGCQNIVAQLDLPRDVLAATLWIVICQQVGDTFKVAVFGYGDGQLVVKTPDGGTVIYYVTFPSGAPFYPMYSYDQKNEKLYVDTFGTKSLHGIITNSVTTERECLYHQPFVIHYNLVQCQSMFISTDGFRTYGNDIEERTGSMKWALNRLVDLKSHEGVFIQRRMKALARRDLKDKIGHFDDLGAAGILMMKKNPDEVQNG